MEAYSMNEPKLDQGIQTEAPSRDQASMIHVSYVSHVFSHTFLILAIAWSSPSTERRMILFEYKSHTFRINRMLMEFWGIQCGPRPTGLQQVGRVRKLMH